MLVKRCKVRGQDVPDLVQDIFIKLLRTLPDFQYDGRHTHFRAYLRQVCCNKVIDFRRKQSDRAANDAGLFSLEDARAAAELEEVWELDHKQFLVRKALELMQAEFRPTTWKACWEFVVEGRPAAEVAAELGITENAVFVAKYHVLGRLRSELAGLVDE